MFTSIINYFTSAFEELKKVVWPSRKEVTSHTIIVVISIAVGMMIISLIDLGLFSLLQKLIYQNTI